MKIKENQTVTRVPGVPGDTFATLNHVVAVGPNDAWAFGSTGHIEPTNLPRGGGLIVHWDGSRWSLTSGPGLAKVAWPDGIAAAPDGSAWAIASCGKGHNVVLGWNRTSWTVVPPPPNIQWNGTPVARRRSVLRACG